MGEGWTHLGCDTLVKLKSDDLLEREYLSAPMREDRLAPRGCLERRILGVKYLRLMVHPLMGRSHAYGTPAPGLHDRLDR